MIDRYAFYNSIEQVASDFSLKEIDNRAFVKKYNAAPTQKLPIILDQNGLTLAYYTWGGTQELAKNKPLGVKIINLNIGLSPSSLQRKLITTNRCVIPCNGFFAWKQIGKKKNIPYYFYVEDMPLCYIAGVWDNFEDLEGTNVFTFRLITKPSIGVTAQIHESTPCILSKELAQKYIDSNTELSEVLDLIQSNVPSKINHHTVNPNIQYIEANEESLIRLNTPSDQLGNYTLFG